MDKDRWQLVEEIVDQALMLEDEGERTAFLISRLSGDEELRDEVTSLLDSIKASEGMWDSLFKSNKILLSDISESDAFLLPESGISTGDTIGQYSIRRHLGRGGMGDVYLASRKNADFHQNVALKTLRNTIPDEDLNRRFLQERSILSRLNHPHIAKLLDGGVSEKGVPYFVMEYVDGLPITDYCIQYKLELPEKIELFKQACDAVQYAHANFVVHRDLKPANLLVTNEGTLKILDFGIAKILDRELSEDELHQTRSGNRLLSLSYAAPEQITMDSVSAATDVYALGLVFFEMITGTKAFDLKGKKLSECEQIIRNESPPLPSNKIGPAKKLSPDLDAIILKTLRKTPQDRYSSVLELVADLERFQKNRPVFARKGTRRYKAVKYIRRNRFAIATFSFFLVVSLLFAIFHINEITRERNIARSEAEKARKVTDFLTGIFEYADPYKQPNTDLTAIEILHYGTDYIQNEIKEQPEIKASLLSSVGSIYETLGSYDRAEEILEEARQLELTYGSGENGDLFDLASILYNLGNVKASKGEYEDAINLYQQAASHFNTLNQPSYRAGSLGAWGWNAYELAKYDEADSLLNLALKINYEHDGRSSPETAHTLNRLAWLEHDKSNYQKSDSLFNVVLQIRREYYEGDHPDIANTLHSIGWINFQMKNYSRANKMLSEAIAMRIRLFGSGPHYDVAWSKNNLGLVKQAEGNLEEAESLFNQALEMRKAVLPAGHPHIAQSLGNLGSLYFYRKDYEKSAKVFNEVLDIQRRGLGDHHPNLALYLNNLATVLTQAKKPKEALKYYKEALEIQNRHFKKTHSNTMRMRDNMADAHEELQEFQKAELLRLENFEAIKAEKGISNEQTQKVLQNVISLYEKWGLQSKTKFYKTMLVSGNSD